jgi:hypothetical protein
MRHRNADRRRPNWQVRRWAKSSGSVAEEDRDISGVGIGGGGVAIPVLVEVSRHYVVGAKPDREACGSAEAAAPVPEQEGQHIGSGGWQDPCDGGIQDAVAIEVVEYETRWIVDTGEQGNRSKGAAPLTQQDSDVLTEPNGDDQILGTVPIQIADRDAAWITGGKREIVASREGTCAVPEQDRDSVVEPISHGKIQVSVSIEVADGQAAGLIAHWHGCLACESHGLSMDDSALRNQGAKKSP